MKNSVRYTRYKHLLLCVFLTAFMLGCAPSPEKSTGTHVDDAWITSKVKSELLADPQVSGLDIQVETYKGKVQLSGYVENQEQVREAVDIARSIEGVKAVENRLTVVNRAREENEFRR